MSEYNPQMYGLFGTKYYAVTGGTQIIIPSDLEYQASAVIPRINESLSQAEIDMYRYHSDLVTNCNVERVRNMKDYLLAKKVTEIPKITGNYIVGIAYDLYNKEGKVIRSGNSEVDAVWYTPIILEKIKEGNMLEYRKGLILDGHIQICIPEIACYGIKNCYNQHPYTLKIRDIYAVAANGDYKHITECGSQMNTDTCECAGDTNHHHHCGSAQYHIHHHNGLCDTNFNSCFITNAKIGTTIIDQVVASATLDAPVEYEKIDIFHTDCSSLEYTLKLNAAIKHILVNLEVFVDNFNEVYDAKDIENLLLYNGGEADAYDPDSDSCDCDDCADGCPCHG